MTTTATETEREIDLAERATELLQGEPRVDDDDEGDEETPMPSLEYMRGYVARMGPSPSYADLSTMREWLGLLIDETERIRGELLDIPVQPQVPDERELTATEVRIFRYLRNTAMSNQEIAYARYVSLNTVKTHVKNIYAKLGVNRRAELKNIGNI